VGHGNVCTTSCSSAADCVAGWTCAPEAGQPGNVCQCAYAPEVCDGKDNDCNGIVDDAPATDPACASQMGSGGVCQGGKCACGSGTQTCGGKCTDTSTDKNNCGGCAKACPSVAVCNGGKCACPASGQTLCGSTCIDTQSDAQNCGGCGKTCAAGQACAGGSCSCPTAGQTYCGSACTDTSTDGKNCGACGHVCPASAPACVQSHCTCPSTYTVCGGACVDLTKDPNNCGSCGTACPSGYVCGGQLSQCQGSITVCVNGTQQCALTGEVCDGYNRCVLNCCSGLTGGSGTCGPIVGGGTSWYATCAP
jgi:hypothetical protein